MLEQMQRFAVNRDQQLRSHPRYHVAQLVATWIAGDMDEVGPVGDHLDALHHRPLMMAPTAFSLPGMVREEKITLSPLFSVTCG